jgi:hypothetical protein
MHTHLAKDVAKTYLATSKLDAERRGGEVLKNFTLHLDDAVFRHTAVSVNAPEDSCS